jgi:phosphoglycolate phosphatase
MRYRIAIFDFDGTLADSFPWFLEIVNDVADRFGFRRIEEHEVDTLRGYDVRGMIRHLRTPAWKLPLIARHMRARMAADIDRITLFPGVGGLLRALHGHGVAIAIVTSNSEANVRRVLGAQNAALVRHYGCGASLLGKRSKLRRVLRASGIQAADAVKIGDEIRDLHAARAAGMAFYAVGWGYTHAAALAEHRPDAVFTSMDELAGALTSDASPLPATEGRPPPGGNGAPVKHPR